MSKPILCLDFDGVIHSYSSGWKGADVIPDAPVPGAIAFILGALLRFDVVIFSSRSNQNGGVDAMRAWLKENAGQCWYESPLGPGLEDVRFTIEKPPAMVTIDDRALTFDGSWPDIAELLAFQPWNKKPDRLGATGDFPRGRLNQQDEGALKVAVGTENGVVKLDFGKRIAWIGLPKQEAIAWANVILKHAEGLPDIQ